MGMIQNKVTVSQPVSHVIVQDAGGLRGLTGPQGEQGPQGIPGADGKDGKDGKDGAAATISVGSTSTLPAGSSATVTNSGTSSAAVFDFGIPKGDKGDTGATGADGYSPSATVTKTGDTATITITDKDGTTTASISDGSTPTVNDGTLTIQKNGTTVQTFSADQASNVTANITVPTQFSDLSGTVSSSQIEDEAITTGSVSGTGTNITLAGTMEGGAIESVGLNGDTTQTTYSGKNKAKFNSSYTANGITTTLNDDGSLTCSGTTTTTYFNTLPYQETLPSMLPAGTYTFSRGGDTTYAVQIQLWDSTKNQTLTFRIPAGQTSITDTTTFDAYYYGSSFVYLSANMQINTTVKLQLESGSTATSFEPYVGGTASPNPDYPQNVNVVTGEQTITISDGGSQSQSYSVNLGKNLLDEATMEQGTFSYIDGYESAHTGVIRMDSYMPCRPNTTYTLSSDSVLGEVGVVYKDSSGTVVQGFSQSAETITSYSFTTKSNAYQMRVRVGKGAYPHTAGTDYKLQLELGSTATTYAPYFTPIELCKIGTYQDYIYKSGEDWYIHKETGNYVLEAAKVQSSYYYRYRYAKTDIPNSNIPSGSLDMKFQYFNVVASDVGGIGTVYAGGTMLNFRYDQLGDNIDGFKTWITNTNPSVYYALATPTDTQITNATLISELEDLLSATTYSGTTYITVSGDLASPLEVVAEADSKLAPDSVYGAAIKDGAVSVDKIENGAVTPAKISTSAYQSGETAVGTWIDGKTIYRQVLTGTVQITANNVATVTTTIAAKSIVSTSGWYQSWKQNDTTSNKVAFGQLMGNNIYSYALIRSGNYIELGFISSVNVNSQYEVVVEYTKKD